MYSKQRVFADKLAPSMKTIVNHRTQLTTKAITGRFSVQYHLLNFAANFTPATARNLNRLKNIKFSQALCGQQWDHLTLSWSVWAGL